MGSLTRYKATNLSNLECVLSRSLQVKCDYAFGLPIYGSLLKFNSNTVNSLMFIGINVCVFEAKLCLRGLIFAVSSSLVICIHELCLRGIYFAI